MKLKDLNDPCSNCKHLGEPTYATNPPGCYYCEKPEYTNWE